MVLTDTVDVPRYLRYITHLSGRVRGVELVERNIVLYVAGLFGLDSRLGNLGMNIKRLSMDRDRREYDQHCGCHILMHLAHANSMFLRASVWLDVFRCLRARLVPSEDRDKPLCHDAR